MEEDFTWDEDEFYEDDYDLDGACPQCYSTNVQTTLEGTFCGDCGSVVSDGNIVNDVRFSESSTGQSSVIGQFLSSDMASLNQSRMITVRKAKQHVTQIGEAVGISNTHINQALNIYKLALNNKFTRGRNPDFVSVACLYTVCRRNRTPHFLIDFADYLRKNVFKIGRTYLQLCKCLCLRPPVIDPSIYIPRFAARLEFNDKLPDVSKTAIRIVQRMNRDWIVAGRRPSGVCGGAIILAARSFGFDRSYEDISTLVKIGTGTLKKRIREFLNTPSADLTPYQLMTIDFQKEMDPPCLIERRKREEKVRLAEEDAMLEREVEIILDKEERLKKNIRKERRKNKKKGKKRKRHKGKQSRSKKSKKESDNDMSLIVKLQMEMEIADIDFDADIAEPLNPAPLIKRLPPLPITTGFADGKIHYDENGEMTYSDLDEDELDSYLIDDEEDINFREDLWMYLNKDYFVKKLQKLENNGKVKIATKVGRRGRSLKPVVTKSSKVNWSSLAQNLDNEDDDIVSGEEFPEDYLLDDLEGEESDDFQFEV
eukprot:TRINITY_DN9019_c0_g1_i2.p1 TRINITY_DN9019_c0_g1~~TRINITY_DN9019_c0_g1_i2.p1  ORF type:complete len:540 (-),score=132.08 TRINITY_DN9019_c0_g1_i2:211-1830(-)